MKKTMHDYMRDVPEVAGNLLKDCKGLAAGFVENLKGKEHKRYIIVASGSSSNIAENVRYFVQKVMNVPVSVMTPATFMYYEIEQAGKDVLAVFLSQSGYSTNTNAAAAELAEKGGDCVAFCNYLDSPMAKEVKSTYTYGNVPGDYFVAKGFTVSSLSLMIHFLELALAKGKVNKKQYDDYVRQFKTAIAAYEKFMKAAETFYDANKSFCRSIYRTIFTGYGPGLAIAKEGTLKFLETFGAAPIAFELEEFLHGPDYSVNKDTTVFMVIPKGSRMEDRAAEVREKLPALTDRIVAVTNDRRITGRYVICVDEPDMSEETVVLALIAPMQYIADRICTDLRVGTETLAVKKFCDSISFKAEGSEGKF